MSPSIPNNIRYPDSLNLKQEVHFSFSRTKNCVQNCWLCLHSQNVCCTVSLAIRQKLHLLLLVTPISLNITFVPIILCIILIWNHFILMSWILLNCWKTGLPQYISLKFIFPYWATAGFFTSFWFNTSYYNLQPIFVSYNFCKHDIRFITLLWQNLKPLLHRNWKIIYLSPLNTCQSHTQTPSTGLQHPSFKHCLYWVMS